jgi:drug/metabolite transporter (DMT)-like permease
MQNLDKPLVQWTLLLFLAFIWGSSFILMKLGLESFSWGQVASLRIVISTLFLSPILFKNFKRIKKNQWWKICIAGLLGSGIPAYLFPLAQTQISSSLTGMLNSLVPLFTVIIGLLFFKMGFRWLKMYSGVLWCTGVSVASCVRMHNILSGHLVGAVSVRNRCLFFGCTLIACQYRSVSLNIRSTRRLGLPFNSYRQQMSKLYYITLLICR